MEILLRIVVLVTISLLGGLLYALSINILIMTNIIPTEILSGNFGHEITSKAVLIWIISTIIGVISIFIKAKWRYALLICPLIMPSIFALLYSLSYS